MESGDGFWLIPLAVLFILLILLSPEESWCDKVSRWDADLGEFVIECR